MDTRLKNLEVLGKALAEMVQDQELLAQARAKNAWFTPAFVQRSLEGWAHALRPEALAIWATQRGTPPLVAGKTPLIVGVLCAGNLPLVGLHDILMGYLAGLRVHYKPSSEDAVVLPAVVKKLLSLDATAQLIQVEKMTQIDALLATGSDNTLRYFRHYFGHIPHVLSGSRTSVAVLTGQETEEDMAGLSEDIFSYFGRGCRSVTHVFVPQDFDIQRLFAAWYGWGHLAEHARYGSNYDYHRALFMLNKEPFLENNFALLREHASLKPPVGVVHMTRYPTKESVDTLLSAQKEALQTIVGHGYATAFGQSQWPELWDFADQMDTYAFLMSLD